MDYNFKVTFQRTQLKTNQISITPNGRIAAASDDKTVKIFDLGGKVSILNDHKQAVLSAIGLPDGRILSGSKDKTIKVWDTNDQCIATIPHQDNQNRDLEVSGFCLLPDGQIASSGLCYINILDSTKFQSIHTIKNLDGHMAYNFVCVTSNRDGLLITGEKSVKVWDKDQLINKLEGHKASVNSIDVLPDGRVVSASTDKTIKVWDIRSGTCTNTITYTAILDCIGVLPDGRVVTGSHDKNLKLWDIDSGKCVGTLTGHTTAVTCVAVFPDGRFTSVGNDGIIKVWEDANATHSRNVATATAPTPHANSPAPTQHVHTPASSGHTQTHVSPVPVDTSSSLGALSEKIASTKLQEKEEAKRKIKEEFAKTRLKPKKDYGGIDKKPRGISYIDLEFVLTNSELPIFKDAQKTPGGIYTYLDPFFKDSKLNEVVDCIMRAEGPTFTVKKDVKTRAGIAEKLFLRNKPLNDVVRCMVICSNEADGPDDFMQNLAKLREDSKNYFSYWVEDDTGKAGWGTYKVYVHYTQLPGKVFPVEVQFVSKVVYDLEKEAQTHSDYESVRQNFGALSVYQYRKLDHVTLFNEIPDLNGVWQRYIQ